ncbi:D-glycero-beta-D-manno-heptose 1-phosphate adenylyltransferase [Candidatus Korobacter versatilis]|uniref:D-glycero-beta-D-manno-heptose 1-phosphate adenylyltransferase n=1 Tax=Candidatus Korobacter versatilis TaxID=658062 RepID=UPI0038CC053A
MSHRPTRARQVFDVSGAGDTVIATLAAGLASGMAPIDAIELANLAAGVVVGKVGTAPILQHELIAELSVELQTHFGDKILTREALAARARAWRANGDHIVFTNGCFDLLHVGHVTLLEEARRLGTRLIVAINSDKSVSKLKGESRPLVGEKERAKLLAALASVDAVTIFDESTPLECIKALQPDVLVKGGDYSEETIVGAAEVKSWNGRVVIVPTVPGFSTTSLISKMTTSGK